jgi:hypothetical protein
MAAAEEFPEGLFNTPEANALIEELYNKGYCIYDGKICHIFVYYDYYEDLDERIDEIRKETGCQVEMEIEKCDDGVYKIYAYLKIDASIREEMKKEVKCSSCDEHFQPMFPMDEASYNCNVCAKPLCCDCRNTHQEGDHKLVHCFDGCFLKNPTLNLKCDHPIVKCGYCIKTAKCAGCGDEYCCSCMNKCVCSSVYCDGCLVKHRKERDALFSVYEMYCPNVRQDFRFACPNTMCLVECSHGKPNVVKMIDYVTVTRKCAISGCGDQHCVKNTTIRCALTGDLLKNIELCCRHRRGKVGVKSLEKNWCEMTEKYYNKKLIAICRQCKRKCFNKHIHFANGKEHPTCIDCVNAIECEIDNNTELLPDIRKMIVFEYMWDIPL